ncbi:hypothetical protein HanIR_Chr17g0872591 [Helianthus annuus]|nr:hypothetical protein HanIR_Chr17g0872591 [Helianthus annuus]
MERYFSILHFIFDHKGLNKTAKWPKESIQQLHCKVAAHFIDELNPRKVVFCSYFTLFIKQWFHEY